jgi:hypothetical protein
MNELTNEVEDGGRAAGAIPEDPETVRSHRSAVYLLVFIVIFLGLVAYDLSDIILMPHRRATVMQLVRPGMRITQAERALNAAGFQTMYEEPQGLRVSLLRRQSWIINGIRWASYKLRPGSRAALGWISSHSAFYIVAGPDELVRSTPAGQALTASAGFPEITSGNSDL